MPKRKTNTWKSDPRANDHGSLISTALGKKITVKGTRTDKVQRGVIGEDVESYKDELVRHVSSPFEITLVSGIRAGGKIPLNQVNSIIQNAFKSYIGGALKFLKDKEETGEGTTASDRSALADTMQNLSAFAPRIFNTIDTIRCAQVANEKYYRKHCVDMVYQELMKEIDTLCDNERDYWKAENDLLWTLVVGTLLGLPDLFTRVNRSKDKWRDKLEGMPVHQVVKIAESYVEKCKPENLVDESDSMYKSLQITIELAHLLSKVPRQQGAGKTPQPAPQGNNAGGEPDPNKENLDGNGHSSVVDKTDFTNAVDFSFNESLQVMLDKLNEKQIQTAKEKAESENYVGGAVSPVDVGARSTVKIDDSDGMTDQHVHQAEVRTFTQEPVKLNANTVNLLQDIERQGMASRHRVGMPTADVWQIKRLGNTKVFGKAMKKSGKLLVMIDCSGSMGDGYIEGDNGYLAYQASTAIAEAFPQAEVFGFNSSYDKCFIYPIQQGYMLGKKAKEEGWRHGGNTDCSALLFMEQMMLGDLGSSLAVVISDGAPNNPSPLENVHLRAHTKKVAHRLYQEGLRFVSVLVGNYADNTYYPSDVTVTLNEVADMHKVGDAIQRIGQTFT
jgi:hypothetical protein